MLSAVETIPPSRHIASVRITTEETNGEILGEIRQNIADLQDIYVIVGQTKFSLEKGTTVRKTALELLRFKYPNDTPIPSEWILSNRTGILSQSSTSDITSNTWTNVFDVYTHLTIQLVLPH